MISTSNAVSLVQNAEECFQAVKNGSKEVIKSALLAIKNNRVSMEGLQTSSLQNFQILPTNLQVQALVRFVFKQDALLEDVAEKTGYNSGKEYVVKQLSQALWNLSPVVVDSGSAWIGELMPSLVEVAESYDEDVVFTFFQALKQRLLDLSLEKATEYGWITREEDRAAWPQVLLTWKKSWRELKKQIAENTKLDGFSDEEEEREAQYRDFVVKLNQVFSLLLVKNQDHTFFHVDLPDLKGVCYTGLQSRIEQMIHHAKLGSGCIESDYMVEAHKITRGLRYDILSSRALPAALTLEGVRAEDLLEESSNVHNRVLLRQWANKLYHLGISADPLEQEEPMFAFIAPHLVTVSSAIMSQYYTPEVIKDLLKQAYNALSREKKDGLFAQIIDKYKEDLLLNKTPYIDRMDSLRRLYRSLNAIKNIYSFNNYSNRLKMLHSRFNVMGIAAPFSALTPKELLEVQLKSSSLAYPLFKGESPYAFLKRKDSMDSEEKEKLLSLLSNFKKSESRKVKIAYVVAQKKRITSLVKNLEAHIALENGRLLKSYLENEKGELEPFGAALWGVSAKVLLPVSSVCEGEAKELLCWASKLLLSKAAAEGLKQAPDIYCSLPLDVRNTAAVKAVFR